MMSNIFKSDAKTDKLKIVKIDMADVKIKKYLDFNKTYGFGKYR